MANTVTVSCIVPDTLRVDIDELARERSWTRSHATAWLLQRALDELHAQRAEEANGRREVRVGA